MPVSSWQILERRGNEPTATNKNTYGFTPAKGTVPVKTNDKPMPFCLEEEREG